MDAPPKANAAELFDRKLALLLAMAMFVLVVDTSLMNVSISSVVHDLHTSSVLSPAEQTQVANGLEDNAELMSNTKLAELLVDQPADVQTEIIRINTDARPIALQVAMLIPLIAALIGIVTASRMTRLPDPEPTGSADGMVLG
jgi:hypothetical protein